MAVGLQNIPAWRIPKQWDAAWFQDFIQQVLKFSDTRNSIEGPGIQITGQSDEPATITATENLLQLLEQNYVLATPSLFLPNERILEGQPGVINIVDDGPGGDITVRVISNSIGPAQFRQSAALSVVGRPQPTSGNVNDIVSTVNDTLLTRIADRLDFTQLTLGMAPDELWTYAKLQPVSAASRLLGRGDSAPGAIEEIDLGSGLAMTGTTLSATPPALTETVLTATDETATLVNSRQLLAGTNVAFDDTTPGARTVNVSSSGAPDTLTYLTEADETADLPNSRQVLPGTNITFDDTTPGERTINATGGGASAAATYLTENDETAGLPNSRQLLAGTNVTFDDSVAGERTVNATGGSSAPSIVTDATTAHTLDAGDYFNYLRMTNAAANTITVPANGTLAIPVGTIINGRQAGAGQTSFVDPGGVTINLPTGYIATTRAQGSNWSLIKVATDEWDLSGDLDV